MTLKSFEYVSYRCGTSAGPSINSTAAIYLPAFQRADKKAADKLQNLFKKKPIEKPKEA